MKEPLARLANKQDQTRGAFFEERFKSIAILDEESLLATCAYIDLNPVAAGIVEVPEKGPHTSITQRVKSVKSQDRATWASITSQTWAVARRDESTRQLIPSLARVIAAGNRSFVSSPRTSERRFCG